MSVYEMFLERYPSDSTRSIYGWALGKYFGFFHKSGRTELQIERYLDKVTGIEQVQLDLDRFFAANADMAPKSLGVIEGCLRAFFKFLKRHDSRVVEYIDVEYWKELKRRIKGLKSQHALTADTIPTASELRRILDHLNVHGKALFLVLSSGGMRIGDALNIRMNDIHLDQRLRDGTIYHEIKIDDQKTGARRDVFISDEAVEAVKEWLHVREDWLVAAAKKCRPRPQYVHKFKGKSPNDDRLFPFTTSNAREICHLAIQKAELDKRDDRTDRFELHPHSLRKFFRTKLGGSGIPIDAVEALMGHEGYLGEEYRRYSKDDFIHFYIRGTSALNIYGDNTGVLDQLKVHKKAIRALAEIAMRGTPRERIIRELQEQGVDFENVSVGGGKAIKAEWEMDEETLEILKILRDLE